MTIDRHLLSMSLLDLSRDVLRRDNQWHRLDPDALRSAARDLNALATELDGRDDVEDVPIVFQVDPEPERGPREDGPTFSEVVSRGLRDAFTAAKRTTKARRAPAAVPVHDQADEPWSEDDTPATSDPLPLVISLPTLRSGAAPTMAAGPDDFLTADDDTSPPTIPATPAPDPVPAPEPTAPPDAEPSTTCSPSKRPPRFNVATVAATTRHADRPGNIPFP